MIREDSELGPLARTQLGRLAVQWEQGEHILVSGGTGSGKTRLTRSLLNARLRRGGHVVVLFAKLKPDDTITEHFSDFVRWKTWKRRPKVTENKVLLWPDVEGREVEDAARIMHEVFLTALREIGRKGDWTVVIDDGLFITSPHFLALGQTVAMMHMLVRSAKGTLVTLVQRPAHIPVTIYPNLSYALIGRASERNDVTRLAEMAASMGARDLSRQIRANGTHDFTLITVGKPFDPEQVNLRN